MSKEFLNIDMIDKDKPLYSISSAARMLNISVHTLRMYEKEKLILPYKKNTNHRLYSEHDIERIQCVRNSIKEKKFTIPAIKTIYSFIPCWDIKKCSNEDRNNCPAFLKSEGPCWAYGHENNVCSEINCRECQIYTDFNNCDKIKDKLRDYTTK